MTEPPPRINPNEAYKVYVMESLTTKGELVAQAVDLPSAAVLASGVFAAKQNYSPNPSFLLGILDTLADSVVAFVGGINSYPQATPQNPDPIPTLTSLVPDSSGNWAADVKITGTNFTSTTEVLANGAPVTPVTHTSPTELHFVVPATAAGAYTVTARNGTQVSNPLTFTAL